MKITAEQVEKKQIAGQTKDGDPVVYVATKGGLHAFFLKNSDGDIETISAAPHRAIAKWMAEQKHPDIKWEEVDLEKAEQDLFNRLRTFMFQESTKEPLPNPDNVVLVYNTSKGSMVPVQRDALPEKIAKGEVDRYCLYRDMSMTQDAEIIGTSEEFGSLFKE